MATNPLQQSTLNKSRVDKFLMVFNLPVALKEVSTHQIRTNKTVQEDAIKFSIYGTIVPELQVPGLEIRYAGSTLYNSTHSRAPYPPVSVKFNVDNEYNNYWVIYQWLNLLHDEKTGIFDQRNLVKRDEFHEYQTDISVYGLDEYDTPKIQFTYTKAFPTTLGGITYNYQESSEIQSSFTFVYAQLHTKLLN